jgi:hypothetical protein
MEAKTLTLAEKIDLELQCLSNKGELYAPGLDQPPVATSPYGEPVPEGVLIRMPLHPKQPHLALRKIEREPTPVRQQELTATWDAMDKDAAAKVEAIAKAAAETAAQDDAAAAVVAIVEAENRLYGFTESPEILARLERRPEGALWFADAVKEPWCAGHYKTETLLRKYLLLKHYPARMLNSGLITEIGFNALMKVKRAAKNDKDKARRRKTPAPKAVKQSVSN